MAETVNKKLNRIENKLEALSGIEDNLEKIVAKEDKEIKKIEKEEASIEKSLVKIGNFSLKRSRVLELARGTAGAFLGVGLGQALGGSVALAHKIPWPNSIGLLAFIFIMAGLLIYKNDKTLIQGSQKHPLRYITDKIVLLYAISLVVETVGLVLFNNFPGWNSVLVKALVVGSFPAMSSAAAFSIL